MVLLVELEKIGSFKKLGEGSVAIVARIEIRVLALDETSASPQFCPFVLPGIFRYGIAQDIDQLCILAQLRLGLLSVRLFRSLVRVP